MRRKGYRFLAALLCAGLLAGCGAGSGDGNDGGGAQDGQNTQTDGGDGPDLSNIYSGELEQNVTIRVLENDTAIE